MSTPQNPYQSNSGSGDQNSGDPAPSAPQYGAAQPSGDDAQQAAQPASDASATGPDATQAYDSTRAYDSEQNNASDPYGNQPGYGQNYGSNQNQPYEQSQGYGQPSYDQNQPSYDQNQGYGQPAYDPNSSYNQPQYGQSYDANQYGQQPAYSGTQAAGDQFVPANPNSAYGAYPPAGMGGNTSKNIWGLLALIAGIVGVVLAFAYGAGFIFGVFAVIAGFIGLSAFKKGTANNRGKSLTGVILGFVAIVLSIVMVIVYTVAIIKASEAITDNYASSAPTLPAPIDPSAPAGAGDPSAPSGAADPGTGATEPADPGDTAPAEGGEVDIAPDVTAAVGVKNDKAGQYAAGAEDTNGEIAVVTMTVTNSSKKDLDLSLALLTADDGSGAQYQSVFDSGFDAIFGDPVPAGDKASYKFAFAVPAAKVNDMHVKLSLVDDLGKGTDFEFSKAV